MSWKRWAATVGLSTVLAVAIIALVGRCAGPRGFFGIMSNSIGNPDDWLGDSQPDTTTKYTVNATDVPIVKQAEDAVRELLNGVRAARVGMKIDDTRYWKIVQYIQYIRFMGDGKLRVNPATTTVTFDPGTGSVTWVYEDPGAAADSVAKCIVQAWHMATTAPAIADPTERAAMWDACIERLEQGH
jgi:hypothetical protein